MIIAMVFQSKKPFPSLFNWDAEAILLLFWLWMRMLWLSAGDVGYSDCTSSGSASKILVPGEHLQQVSLPSFPSCCYCWTYRKETQAHKLCVSHILLCPCSQEELSENQDLDVCREVSLGTALMAASLCTAYVEEVLEESKGLGSRGK